MRVNPTNGVFTDGIRMAYTCHTDAIPTAYGWHSHELPTSCAFVDQVGVAQPVRTPLLSHGQAENAARNQGIVGVGSVRGPARLPMQQAGLYRAPSIQTVTVTSSDDVDSSAFFHDRRKGCVKGDTSVMASDALIFRTMGVSCLPILPGETGNLETSLSRSLRYRNCSWRLSGSAVWRCNSSAGPGGD